MDAYLISYRAPLRAERHADTDLPLALADGVGDDSVQTHMQINRLPAMQVLPFGCEESNDLRSAPARNLSLKASVCSIPRPGSIQNLFARTNCR